MAQELQEQIAALRPGDHLCLLYETREEQVASALPFLHSGIGRGDRCLYIVDELTAAEVRGLLEDAGVDVAAAEDAGLLTILTKRESYLRSGEFDPQAMLALLDANIEEAEGAPSGGSTVTGEMTWAMDPGVDHRQLIEYEARLNDLIEGRPAVILCQYNRTRFPPETILGILRTHPIVVIGGQVCPNPYYQPPEAVLGQVPAEEEVERQIATLLEQRRREHAIRDREVERRARVERSETRYRRLFEQSRDAVFVTAPDGRALEANPACLELLGHDRASMLATPVTNHYRDAEDRAGYLDVLRGGGCVEDYPVDLVQKDGTVLHCLLSAALWEEEEGERIQGVIRDVTAFRRSQDALRGRTEELQERVKELRCLYDVSTILDDPEGSLDELLRDTVRCIPDGWRFSELAEARLALDGREWKTPGYRTTSWAQTIEFEAGDQKGTLEVTYTARPPDPEPTFLPEESELLRALAERVSDAVRRHRLREELNRSEARFRSLIEMSGDVISIHAPDGRTLYTSPAVQGMLGYAHDELERTDPFTFVHPDDVAEVARALQACLSTSGGTVRARYRCRHRDGTWRTVESVGRNLVDRPEVAGVAVSTRDVTAQQELERQLQHALKMEAVGRLAAGVAHDFNNVLTAIAGYTSLLRTELPEGRGTRDADEIMKAVDRARALTSQLLAFGSRQVLEPEVLDPARIVLDMEDMLRRLIGEDVRVECRLMADPAHIRVDRSQLEQVLLNLVVNAREAMPCGGSVTIRSRREEAEGAEDLNDGAYLVLAVDDTGCGVPEEIQADIFDPFFTTKDSGNGLGLSTVFGIVTQSGGTVRIARTGPDGTTFEAWFPLADAGEAPEEAPVEPGPRPAGSVLGSETVLLVEDEDAIRDVSRRFLERMGYTVLAAASGADALRTVEAHRGQVDLVLSDLVMPGMHGRELARRMRAARPEVALLLMTGYTSPSLEEDPEDPPGIPVLQKPFTLEALALAVRSALD